MATGIKKSELVEQITALYNIQSKAKIKSVFEKCGKNTAE